MMLEAPLPGENVKPIVTPRQIQAETADFEAMMAMHQTVGGS